MELEELITRAQAGDMEAKNELVKVLKDNGAMKQLARYLYKNRLLEPDDVKGEFWLGVVKAMYKVKYNIGNPLQYLIWQGVCNVKNALRRTINKNVDYICQECGYHAPLRRYDDTLKCRRCGSTDLITEQLTNRLPDETQLNPLSVRIETKHTTTVDIEGFKRLLTPGERRVLELILEGHDRDSSENYLRDIGVLMNTSPQYVSKCLRGIRIKLRKGGTQQK